MGRPRFADTCRDHHVERGKVYRCQRGIGHRGDHSSGGSISWPRRIERPPSGSSTAASPMR